MYYSRGSLILEAFLSQLVPKPHFALTIKLDPDGIEWTHLIGVLDSRCAIFTFSKDEGVHAQLTLLYEDNRATRRLARCRAPLGNTPRDFIFLNVYGS